MEPTFDGLVAILESQKEIYSELVSLGKAKQTELVKGSMGELETVSSREEALIFQAGRLEEERYCHACWLGNLMGLMRTLQKL